MLAVKNWIMFIALGLIWGSSFLLIKIGLEELKAVEVVAARLAIASIGFCTLIASLRLPLPRDRKSWIDLALVGVMNTTVPFVLITWGEESIDSGLAGVLNATTPLFSFVIAHIALADDKINAGKLLGLLAGFVGVILLTVSSSSHPAEAQASIRSNSIEGQLAVLAAAFFYGVSAVYIRRRLRHVPAMVTAGVTLSVGAVTAILLMIFTAGALPALSSLETETILSVGALGLINTFIAYILYFTLIHNWGASRSTLVTYAIPPISLLLGTLFKGERPDLLVIIGAALIIGGVALANLRKQPARPVIKASAQS
jgi:drug/metabolite transporter (DMT)-like permease